MTSNTYRTASQVTRKSRDVNFSNNCLYLNPIPYIENENIRLAKLIHIQCFYFYLYYPIPKHASNGEAYDLPLPPTDIPNIRRSPVQGTFHISCPYYLMNQYSKILCRATPSLDEHSPRSEQQCYDVSYLSKYAPIEIVLFDAPSKWMPCKWKLYANGDIYYNVRAGLYGPNTGYHYTNYLHKDHSIMRAILPQLFYAIIKLCRILARVRNRNRIRLFIHNTHHSSSSILCKLSGSHWTREKMLIYQYINPLPNAWRMRWITHTT
jgi:hypothetical protein